MHKNTIRNGGSTAYTLPKDRKAAINGFPIAPVLPRWLPDDMNSSQLVQFSLKKISTDGDKKIPREKNKTGEVLLKVG